MNQERREHLRVALPVKFALYFSNGFIYNISVVDISPGGLRVEMPFIDPGLLSGEGTLKLYFQPYHGFCEYPPVPDIPCRVTWSDNMSVGIEFLASDPNLQKTIDNLVLGNLVFSEYGRSHAPTALSSSGEAVFFA